MNVRRLALLGAFLGVATAIAGVAMLSVPAALIVGGTAVAALCVGLDFEPGSE